MDGKLHAPHCQGQRGTAEIKDEVVHVKGAAYTCGHGGSGVVNCQCGNQNAQDAALGNTLRLEKGVREIGSNPNSGGMISEKVLNKA